MYKNPTLPPKNKHTLRWAIIAALVLMAAITALELTNTTHFLHKKPTPVTASAYTKGEGTQQLTTKNSEQNSDTTTSSTSGAQPGDQKSEAGGNSTAALLTPTGDFVSNHHPNLDGSPAPNTISSVCTTTPGATCTIAFIKDGVTKSLPAQTTDRGGSAYWNWKLQDIGITSGSWKVEARASLDGKNVTASDAMQLVVAQ
jgi:hypothetical protein